MKNRSSDVNELFGALAKAQGELKAVAFDSENPHFRNKFASLKAIQETTKPVLSKNGLAIVQIIETEGEANWVHTMLTHSSGQFVQSSIKLVTARNDMQSLGSAVTYAKRYAWQAIIGVSGEEDDDGNAATGGSQPPARSQPKTTEKKTQAKTPPKNQAPADRAQFSRIASLLGERQIGDEVFQKYLKVCHGGVTSKTMTRGLAEELIEMLENQDCSEGFLMVQVSKVGP